ncbi:unnamed protein product [Ectocarpus sp. CCAP 1310/34]|nr:unnamed protein product [Ectocarpus sp. CCAP 1310/34]
MQRLRRTTSTSSTSSQPPARQLSGKRLERRGSSNLNSATSSRPTWRRRLRRNWRGAVFVCVCASVALLSVPRDHRQQPVRKSSIFKPSHRQRESCRDEIDWPELPHGVDIDLHVVARGNTHNLRTTLTSLAEACYPEDAELALHVWALTAHAREVMPAQDGFVWTHGTYQFHTLTTKHGEVPPLEGWARMWTDPIDTEVRLVLPEGLELSNLFYFWLASTLARYLGAGVTMEEREIFRENVFGLSLSATGLSEVSGVPSSWGAYEAADKKRPVFHTLPGARGTAFFGWKEGEALVHVPGGEVALSWAGSLERFLAEFCHGRGLGILHPNLNGDVSFARQLPPSSSSSSSSGGSGGGGWLEEEEALPLSQTAHTPTPTLRGTDDGGGGREPEGLVLTYRDANNLIVKYPSVSSVPAYDLLSRRHRDVTHLRLQAYRFFQRLRTSVERNKDLEDLWKRPGMPKPNYALAKFLIYQPQFGMGNQLRALDAALAVARVLGRVLVVPDYIADNGEGRSVRYDAIWEFGFLEELVGRSNVILQADFDDLLQDCDVVLPPTKVYLADMPIKQLAGNDEYFGRMGWGELPKVPLPLANATEAGWSELQQMEDQVLAISAMFGMFQGWTPDSTVGDTHWHAMVKLHVSEEASWVHEFVDDSLERFREKATEAAAAAEQADSGGEGGDEELSDVGGRNPAAAEFMCAHVRRQDFEESCSCYEEEYRTGSARDWVKEALDGGGVCWVEEQDFRDTVDVLLRWAPAKLDVSPQFVFATSDDARFLEDIKVGNAVPVFTLDDVSRVAAAARGGGGGGGGGAGEGFRGPAESSAATAGGKAVTPEEVQAALPAIDVAVCSRGTLLMLNYFSTYSALIKTKAKAQPNFKRGLYWADPPALSTRWSRFCGWFLRKWRRIRNFFH